MARPPKFEHDQILDAALSAVADHGRSATVAQVAAALGGPVGSIYHRYRSRQELLVALWLREIRGFHVGLMDAMTGHDPQRALVGAAVHIPRYCRAHPRRAVAMTLYRRKALLDDPPPSLADAVRTLNDAPDAAMDALCGRRYGRATPRRREIVVTAVRQCPYGLVRPYVGGTVPGWIDAAVDAAAAAILALGDRG